MTTEAYTHYLNGDVPAEIAEHLKEFFPEDGDISYEEFIQHQESVYLSIQAYGRNRESTSGQTSNRSLSSEHAGESSQSAGTSQVELDEAFARSLQEQELDEDLEYLHISEQTGAAAERRDATPEATPEANREATPEPTAQAAPVRGGSQSIREDDIDPDNMTYEELQSLGEAVGHENRGLPDEVISRLQSFKYKKGFFSKKQKEECVICYSEYIHGDRLIVLPCAHRYHSKCISRWLSLNKNCPVCQVEVQDVDE